MVIEQLKVKLQDVQHNLQLNTADFQALQSEHDTLLERHNKMLQETVAKEAELREKYGLLMTRYTLCKPKGLGRQLASNNTSQRKAVAVEKVKGIFKRIVCYFLSAFRGFSSENEAVADENEIFASFLLIKCQILKINIFFKHVEFDYLLSPKLNTTFLFDCSATFYAFVSYWKNTVVKCQLFP